MAPSEGYSPKHTLKLHIHSSKVKNYPQPNVGQILPFSLSAGLSRRQVPYGENGSVFFFVVFLA